MAASDWPGDVEGAGDASGADGHVQRHGGSWIGFDLRGNFGGRHIFIGRGS